MFIKFLSIIPRNIEISKKRLYMYSLSFFSKKIKKILNQKKIKPPPQIPDFSQDFFKEQMEKQKKETLDLYNKLIFDIENKKVEPSLEHMYMKQLLEYLELLIEEKTKLIGWVYLGNYFYEKMEKLNDEDFLKCFTKLLKVKFKGTKPDFWNKACNYLIDKKVIRKQLIPLFYSLTNLDTKLVNWENIFNHLNIFTDLDYEDSFNILLMLNKINYELNHPIWDNVINTIKGLKYEKITGMALLNLTHLLLGRMENGKLNDLLQHYKNYFVENVDKFEYVMKVKIATLISHKKLFSADVMSDLVILIFPKINEVSVQEKEQFIFSTITYYNDYPNFKNLLNLKQTIYEKKNGKIQLSGNFVSDIIQSVEK